MSEFRIFCLTPACDTDPALAVAACRAGAVGIFNAEAGVTGAAVHTAIKTLADYGRQPFGLKLAGSVGGVLRELPRWHGLGLDWLIVDRREAEDLLARKSLIAYRAKGGRILVELTRWDSGAEGLEAQIDGWWIKGHEAGGVVGEESSFVLIQRVAGRTSLPVYARGGVGVHNAAACRVGGAAGVVLDNQLLLLRDSPRADGLSNTLTGLAGNETVLLGDEESGNYLRILQRPGFTAVDEARKRLAGGSGLGQVLDALGGWADARQQIMPLGQDLALAAPWASRYHSVASVVMAIRSAADKYPAEALEQNPFREDAPLARFHGTRYPIVQGAMTRVSDTPAFAESVAVNGALPMIALAMLKGEQARPILEETRDRLGEQPWGVGILGFVPRELREEQMAAIRAVHPPFAYIAGGRPDQAANLEKDGIHTYLHVPTPALLRLFLDQGARRFIFEGRECGGHIGPLTSFVLWESVIDTLLDWQADKGNLAEVDVLFAGGIHDARSAAMVSALAAPVVRHGARIGELMGTAYLFTREVVKDKAIKSRFQKVALACSETATLTTGPGHASRCALTPFVKSFHDTRRQMEQTGTPGDERRDTLDALTLGRLRVATKGVMRESGEPKLKPVADKTQLQEGMYMIGQVAAMHDKVMSMAELHRSVSDAATAWLASQAAPMEAGAEEEGGKPVDIAIVGMGGLLPKANTTRRYWENIVRAVNAITEIPAERWDWRLYFDADRSARDKVYSKWGGFLDDVPFDPTRYGMPPLSLKSIDPLQLLTLEVVRQALEDAELTGAGVDREKISVILGASGGVGELGIQYGTRSDLPRVVGETGEAARERLPEWTEDSFAGLLLNVAAGRAANRFDFGGVNCTVDAACASSLAAIYQGVSDLVLGKSDVVVAGGVDTMQSPFAYLCFAKTQALSPRGRCNTFDSGADGIVISEGLAAVVLKRLTDAERDGDRIYAVIKGVGGSSDGRAKGLTAPRPEGQIRALRRAYREAGYSPATVGLFEAHGTGTVAGDRAELETVTRLLADAEAGAGTAIIGSVKTMIGHSKSAAGVSGLIKASLSLYHRTLPPHPGVSKPLSLLSEADCPLFVTPEALPWVKDPAHPRRAGVSAFGFGGTNFHVTLEEYQGDFQPWRKPAVVDNWPAELFLWRAESRKSLLTALEPVRSALAAGAAPNLVDLARSLTEDLPAHGVTLAIVADSLEALAQRIQAATVLLQEKETAPAEGIYFSEAPLLAAEGKLALLFPGQGAQYPGMLRELACHFPALLDTLDEADAVLSEAIQASNGPGACLSRLIYPPTRYTPEADKAAKAALTRTEVAQPAIGAVSAGLWSVLDQLGIQPALAAGHSYGEFVALHAAGVLTQDDLLRLSEARGRFIVEEAKGKDLGTMLAVQAEREAVADIVKDIPGLILANHNAPRQMVLSGTRQAVEAAQAALAQRNIQGTPLPVAAAFHSPLVEPAKARLAAFMAELPFAAPHFPVYSNTTAAAHSAEPADVKALLAEHLARPVQFVDEIQAMYAAGARVFLEVGPKSILTRLTRQILDGQTHAAVAMDDRGGGINGLIHALAALAAEGINLEWKRLFTGRQARLLKLDKLVEETRPTPLPAHAWLVNGGCAHRPGEPGITGKRPLLNADDLARGEGVTAVRAGGQMTEIEYNAEVLPMTEKAPVAPPGYPFPPAGNADYALAAYHETMRQFLHLQERVMMAYLGAAPASAEMPAPQPMAVMPPPIPAAPVVAPQAAAPVAPAAPVVTPEPVAPAPQPASEPTPEPVAAASAEPAGPVDVKTTLLKVASDRTGYPEDMLGLDQDIEADLGIDSIKRVEILGAFQKAMPASAAEVLQAHMEEISGLRTFQAIIDWVEQKLAGGAAASPAPAPAAETSNPFEQTGAGYNPSALLPRFLMQAHTEPVDQAALAPLVSGLYLITPDRLGVSETLSGLIRDQGGEPVTVPEELLHDETRLGDWLDEQRRHGTIKGVVHLTPLGQPPFSLDMSLADWRGRMAHEVKALFALLRATGHDLVEQGVVISASAMGGYFGRNLCADGDTLPFPGGAGLVGLIKTLSFEWNKDLEHPNFRGKVVDLDASEPAPALAAHLFQEMVLAGGRREVGYPDGERTIFRTVPAAITPKPSALRHPGADWVVLATGGARGITAEVLREFMVYMPTLVLVGRSPLPEPEGEDTAALHDPAALRRHFIQEAKAAGETPRPAELERRIGKLLSDREMLANLADFKATGARVDYRIVDVRDEQAFAGLLAELYQSYGRIDAVLHGAGVIEDRLLLEKPQDSVDRVFDTKADSAFLLAKYLRPDALKFLGFFTSVAGRYGNRGQTDYATGNEVVNRLAWLLHAAWGGKVKIAAFNWNPWDRTTHGVGMVTPEIKAQFEARGVRVIEAVEGRRYVRNELLYGPAADVELIAGNSPWEYDEAHYGALPTPVDARFIPVGRETLLGGARLEKAGGGTWRFVKTIDLVSDPYLDDHRLDGTPVLPFAGAMEYIAEAAGRAYPDHVVAELADVRLFKGVSLDRDAIDLEIALQQGEAGEAGTSVLAAAVKPVGQLVIPSYQAKAFLRQTLEEPPVYASPLTCKAAQIDVETVYRRWQFHGPAFQTLTRIIGLDDKGIVARLRPSIPSRFYPPAKDGQWLFDPALVDGAIQTIVIWSRSLRNTTPLPVRLGRARRFGTAPLPEELTAYVNIVSGLHEPGIVCHIALVDDDNRLRLLLENFEGMSSAALNRLGGAWPGGEPATSETAASALCEEKAVSGQS